MKIGIPRALYYYFYPDLWEVFFSSLGMEPIVSNRSSKRTITVAAAVSEAEHCLPNKIFDAHVESLAGEVDLIFIPKIISMVKGHITCPKLGALPDASRAAIARGMKVVSIEINETVEPLKKTLERLGVSLGQSKKNARRAVLLAFDAMKAKEHTIKREQPLDGKNKKYLILGHPYTLNDAFIAEPIIRKLKDLKVPVELVTFEDRSFVPEEILWCTFSRMHKKLLEFNTDYYAGVIQVSTFNCGADSMMIERFRRLCFRKKIPYMVIMVDEHSAQAGIDTRLEAFIDSISWKANG